MLVDCWVGWLVGRLVDWLVDEAARCLYFVLSMSCVPFYRCLRIVLLMVVFRSIVGCVSFYRWPCFVLLTVVFRSTDGCVSFY